MNNRLFDTNIGNLDFQPMPKRFMVWDKRKGKFCANVNNYKGIFGLVELCVFLMRQADNGRPYSDFDLVQSTNLFDRDGNEIFEGSIINAYECHNFGNGDNERDFDGVVVNHKGCWSVYSWNGVDELMQPLYELLPEHTTIISHYAI